MTGWYFAGQVLLVLVVQAVFSSQKRRGTLLVHLGSLCGGSGLYAAVWGQWSPRPCDGDCFRPLYFYLATAGVAAVLSAAQRLLPRKPKSPSEDEPPQAAEKLSEAESPAHTPPRTPLEGETTGQQKKRHISHPVALGRALLLAGVSTIVGFWMTGFDLGTWEALFWFPQRILWLDAPWEALLFLWRSFGFYTYSLNPDAATLYASICWTYSAEYVVLAAIGLLLARHMKPSALRWIGKGFCVIGWALVVALWGTGLASIVLGILHR